MTDRLFERAVLDWLEDGSDRTPRPAIDAVLLAVRTTPQERTRRIPWWSTEKPRRVGFAAAIVLAALVGLGAYSLIGTPSPTPEPSATPTASPPASSAPALSLAPTALPRDASGNVLPPRGREGEGSQMGKDVVGGLSNVHAVDVVELEAFVDAAEGGRAFIQLGWWTTWSCDRIDHVDVARDDATKSVHVVVYEGPTPPSFGDDCNVAVVGSTGVDLGVLPAGSWTVTARGFPDIVELLVFGS